MRCEQCQKFTSYDDPPTVEIQSEEMDTGGTFSLDARVVLACAECTSEMKETTLSLEGDVSEGHTCWQGADGAEIPPELRDPEGPDEWELVSAEGEGTSRSQTHDRHGKPIKSIRYRRTYYGADVTVVGRHLRCGQESEVVLSDDEQASGFDELM